MSIHPIPLGSPDIVHVRIGESIPSSSSLWTRDTFIGQANKSNFCSSPKKPHSSCLAVTFPKFVAASFSVLRSLVVFVCNQCETVWDGTDSTRFNMIAPALKPTKRLTPPSKTCTSESHEGFGVNSLIDFSRPTVAVPFCITSLGIVQLKQTTLLTFWAYQRVSWEINMSKSSISTSGALKASSFASSHTPHLHLYVFVWRYEIRSLCGVLSKEGRTEWRRLAYWRSYAASSQYQSYGGGNSEVSLKMSRFQATYAVCRWDCMILLFVHALLHKKQLHSSTSWPWWHCFKCSCKVLQIWGFFSREFIWLHDSCLWKRARNLHIKKVYSRRQWSATGSSNESCFETRDLEDSNLKSKQFTPKWTTMDHMLCVGCTWLQRFQWCTFFVVHIERYWMLLMYDLHQTSRWCARPALLFSPWTKLSAVKQRLATSRKD